MSATSVSSGPAIGTGTVQPKRASKLRASLTDPTVPAALVIGIGAWEILSIWVAQRFFPRPSAIGARMWELVVTREVTPFLSRSVRDLLMSFAVSVVIAVVVGVAMGSSKRVDAALYPFVSALLAAPIIVFAPVIFALFGFGRETVRIIIVLHCIWVMISNIRDGVLSARRDHLEMASLFGANSLQSARFVRVPSALPLTLTGIEIGFGRAVKGMINGELFITITGLGGMIRSAGSVFDATTILAVVFITILVAIFGVYGIRSFERRLITWTN
jgi:ABC-type nitrate/sulfonate/bicarbonate transport system permease component